MSGGENLFGEKHVQRYRETGGEVGHRWKRGSKILLLTTKGRKSGEPRTKPLIFSASGNKESPGNRPCIHSSGIRAT